MLIAKVTLGFDTLGGEIFTMTAGKLYSNDEIPTWVTKTQNFKDAKKKELISGDYEDKKSLGTDLIKKANSLEINFSKDIEESALEALVLEKETLRNSLLEQCKEKGVDIAANAKISTIQAKLDSLSKE